jgi:hypothetical protein
MLILVSCTIFLHAKRFLAYRAHPSEFRYAKPRSIEGPDRPAARAETIQGQRLGESSCAHIIPGEGVERGERDRAARRFALFPEANSNACDETHAGRILECSVFRSMAMALSEPPCLRYGPESAIEKLLFTGRSG